MGHSDCPQLNRATGGISFSVRVLYSLSIKVLLLMNNIISNNNFVIVFTFGLHSCSSA